MRIWRLDSVETVEVPKGVLIARDCHSTPSVPNGYPHKLEYLETSALTPTWILICNNQRNAVHEIAGELHSVLCRQDHSEGCSWHYGSWEKPLDSHKEYEAKARNLISLLTKNGIRTPSELVQFTQDFLKAMK